MIETLSAERHVSVPPERAWEAVSDHALFGQLATNLARVEPLDADGVGMRRVCTDTRGNTWTERCSVWQPGVCYRVEVDVATYPLPLRLLVAGLAGTFGVAPVDGGSRLWMRFDVTPRGGALGVLAVRATRRSSLRNLQGILDGWAAQLTRPRASA